LIDSSDAHKPWMASLFRAATRHPRALLLTFGVFAACAAFIVGLLLPAPAVMGRARLSGQEAPAGGSSKPGSPVGKQDAEPCGAPCTNRGRASRVSQAEVVKSELNLDCASLHFGGFIPGYGGLELFGIGQNNCPAVETYIPSHYESVPTSCRDCDWRDGATIRERENACNQGLNFIFFAMPNCVRGEWVNTSERVRTCVGESVCHRKTEAAWGAGRGRP
jgi:hypothetical protein